MTIKENWYELSSYKIWPIENRLMSHMSNNSLEACGHTWDTINVWVTWIKIFHCVFWFCSYIRWNQCWYISTAHKMETQTLYLIKYNPGGGAGGKKEMMKWWFYTMPQCLKFYNITKITNLKSSLSQQAENQAKMPRALCRWTRSS